MGDVISDKIFYATCALSFVVWGYRKLFFANFADLSSQIGKMCNLRKIIYGIGLGINDERKL